MAWGPGQSLASGALTADIVEAYVFGSTDAGKNLKTGATYTATLLGNGAYGSDSLGTYFANADDSGDGLDITNTSATAFPAGSFENVMMLIVFTREGAIGANSRAFAIAKNSSFNGSIEPDNGEVRVGGTSNWLPTGAPDLDGISTSTEYALLANFGNGKLFYTGGSSPATFPSGGNPQGSTTKLAIGYNPDAAGRVTTNVRFRFYVRWNGTLSDASCQSIVDNPQQLVGIGGPPASGDTQRLGRGTNRGIARGIYRRAVDWIRTPSGLLVPA